MKITKQYLRNLIKETLQEASRIKTRYSAGANKEKYDAGVRRGQNVKSMKTNPAGLKEPITVDVFRMPIFDEFRDEANFSPGKNGGVDFTLPIDFSEENSQGEAERYMMQLHDAGYSMMDLIISTIGPSRLRRWNVKLK